MGADVYPNGFADLPQVTTQRSGVGVDDRLTRAFDEGGRYQFGFGRPAAVQRGFAGPCDGRHRVHRQPVVSVFFEQFQCDHEDFGFAGRPRRIRAVARTARGGPRRRPSATFRAARCVGGPRSGCHRTCSRRCPAPAARRTMSAMRAPCGPSRSRSRKCSIRLTAGSFVGVVGEQGVLRDTKRGIGVGHTAIDRRLQQYLLDFFIGQSIRACRA